MKQASTAVYTIRFTLVQYTLPAFTSRPRLVCTGLYSEKQKQAA